MTSFNMSDLTAEEQQTLVFIRRKKATLLEEIQVRNNLSGIGSNTNEGLH